MTENATVRYLLHSRLVAIAVFATLIPVFVFIIWTSVAGILESRRELAESQDLLDQLKGRRGHVASASATELHPGSPFLEGPTVTVAGASLLQRVSSAITKVGGAIQSSQVDVDGMRAKDGFVGLLVSCEVDQPALQKLLYDLEAGMPFLYVDQLDAQMPQAAAANEAVVGRLRVILGVSGQWQKSK